VRKTKTAFGWRKKRTEEMGRRERRERERQKEDYIV
jgi:hypothetical protein